MDPPPTSTTNRMAALSVSGNAAAPSGGEKVAPAPVVADSRGSMGSSFQGYPGTTPSLPAVVPMKFYANWEVDRASSNAKQRVLLLGINRFVVLKPEKIDSSFVIAVRLQGHKRTLRSNDINMAPGSAEVSLDISFTLQYSHYFKRKSNTLQVLIQRRKRYKNRHIPGFKTLAIGYLNLDDVLQLGGIREIRVWDTAYLNKNEADLNELNAGTIFVSNCVSQGAPDPAPTSSKATTNNGIPISEEEEDDSTDESDFDDHFGEPSSSNQYPNRGGMKERLRNQRKKLNQRNIKSKLTALLKRFKAQDNGADPSCSGTLPPPTEEELEQIFEELENISDSGPELEPDNMSIISNPKPGLRPFFGSKSDILPAIEDGPRYETSPGDSDDSISDNENAHPSLYYANHGFSTSIDSARSAKQPKAPLSGNLEHRTQSMKITPSGTTNSIASQSVGGEGRFLSTAQSGIGATGKKISDVSVIMEMMSYLEDPNSFIASNVWLCSSADVPWLANVEAGQFKSVKLIDCSTATEVRAALQAVVARIQKFCNSNSVPPPQTVIGLLGGDKLIVNVLRVYVELLQNRTHQDWLNYLRFTLIIPPSSVIGRTLTTLGDGGFAESQWRLLNTIQPNETAALERCLLSAGPHETMPFKASNIPIGEVMLQLDASAVGNESEHAGTTVGSDGQVFIPFIAEIHLGNLEELNSLHYMEEKPSIGSTQSAPASNGVNANLSPPTSPHVSKPNEWKELQIEYWTASSANNNDFITSGGYHHSPAVPFSNSTPKSSTGGKFSMKAAVRTLSVAREPLSTLLSMLFVKERKKDKMLQKLGRKAKPRSADSFNSQSRVVSSVSRMICSGKHSPLEVSIDGATWSKVRFFQITSQWQTHVKFFPISVPAPSKSRGD
uniref:Phosphofurin acidic cluster sorting protein 2 n=1 Tax=Panagrellus redivivus TaxID=6233 RepID=A0A7E4UN95_PANRE